MAIRSHNNAHILPNATAELTSIVVRTMIDDLPWRNRLFVVNNRGGREQTL